MIFVITLFLLTSYISRINGQATESRDVTGFSSIAADGPFSINVEIGDKEGVDLKGNKDFIAAVETPVENGTLKVRFSDWRLKFTGILQINVRAKSILNLIVSGPAQITSQSTITAANIRAVASGSGQIIANFQADNVNLVVSQSASVISLVNSKNLNSVLTDSGTITLSGNVEHANVVVSGSGVFHGKDLNAVTVSTTVNGSGRAEVSATGRITAVAAENGVVRTSGGGKVDKETEDAGLIEAA